MKRAHDIPEITVTFLSEGIVISDSRISRLKTSGTSPGVSAVQTNAGAPRRAAPHRAAPVSNENVEKGREQRRIADGEEIEKERISYHRDNWRDSNGQSESRVARRAK